MPEAASQQTEFAETLEQEVDRIMANAASAAGDQHGLSDHIAVGRHQAARTFRLLSREFGTHNTGLRGDA